MWGDTLVAETPADWGDTPAETPGDWGDTPAVEPPAEQAPWQKLKQSGTAGIGHLLKGVGAVQNAAGMAFSGLEGPPSADEVAEFQRRMERTPSEQRTEMERLPVFVQGQALEDVAPEVHPVTPAQERGNLTKLGGSIGGFVPLIASGPAAPITIGLQSIGEHVTADYEKAKAQGMDDDQAADLALGNALKSGTLQASIFAVLPTPLRSILEKYFVNKLGKAAFSRWLTGRLSASGEGMALGSTSQAGENVVEGEPITKGTGTSGAGLAALNAVLPWLRERAKTPTTEPTATPTPPEPPIDLSGEATRQKVREDLIEQMTRGQIVPGKTEPPPVETGEAPPTAAAVGEEARPIEEPMPPAAAIIPEKSGDSRLSDATERPATIESDIEERRRELDRQVGDIRGSSTGTLGENVGRMVIWSGYHGRLAMDETGRPIIKSGDGDVELPGNADTSASEIGLVIMRREARIPREKPAPQAEIPPEIPPEEPTPSELATEPPPATTTVEMHPEHQRLVDAVLRVARSNRASLGARYGALEAAPTAKRVLSGTIARMEEAGHGKDATDPLYAQLREVEEFENKYQDVVTLPKERSTLTPEEQADLTGKELNSGEVAEPVAQPAKRKGNPFWIRPRSDGVPDILDDIQELGGIRPPGESPGGEYDGFKEAMTGPARMLVKKSSPHGPDTLLDELHSMGNHLRVETPDQLWDAISGAVAERQKLRQTGGGHEAQADKFWSAVLDPKRKSGLERINMQQLSVGDKFRIRGPGISHEELTVTHLDPDTGTMQVKDGPLLGAQDLPDGAQIWVQRGSHLDNKGRPREPERPHTSFARGWEEIDTGTGESQTVPRTQVEAGVKEFQEQHPNVPPIHIVDSVDELPVKIPHKDFSPSGVHVRYSNGKSEIYVISKTVRSMERLRVILNHEAIGHYGIESVMSKSDFANLVLDVERRMAGSTEWGDVVKDYGNGREDYTIEDKLLYGRELVARMAEGKIKELSLWEHVSATVRKWWREHVSPTMDLSDSEIRKALVKARDFTRQRDRQLQSSKEGAMFTNDDPLFGKPETVEQQKAREARETEQRRKAAEKEELAQRAAKPLSGSQGDLGQGDLLGGGDLFAGEPSIGSGAKSALEKNKGEAGSVPNVPQHIVDFGRQLYRRVKDFAQWSTHMLNQFGESVRDHLRSIHDFIQKGFASARADRETEGQRDTSGDLGFNPVTRLFEELPDHARLIFRGMDKQRQKIVDRIKRRLERDTVSKLKDSADNRATVMSNQTRNVVLHELNRSFGVAAGKVKDERNALREMALTFAVEAGGEQRELGRMRYVLTSSQAEGVNLVWKRRALKAIEFADENWERLQPAAELYKMITDAEREYERSKGFAQTQVSGGYVFHAQDADETFGTHSTGNASEIGGAPQPFNHIRDHRTYADAIANGVTPKSLNGLDLLQTRIGMGQRLINYGDFIDALADLTDRRTEQPLIQPLEIRTRADGTEDTTAPGGYTRVSFAGRDVALHNGYTGLFGDLTKASEFQGGEIRRALMQGVGIAKHSMLLFDTFHMGRLMFWNAMTRVGLPGYERGFTLLDNTLPEIRQMLSRGEIPEKWGRQLIEEKENINLLLHEGLNVGGVADNLHTDVLQKIPGIGTFNKWLFQKYQRGAMAEVGLIEMDRQRKMFPEDTPQQLARRVAKDVNTRFGNLQSQGWIKSKTFQDLARVMFLAPQWNESLIRAELGALKQAGQTVKGLSQGRLQMGALARGVGAAILGTFIANQLINYGTRGHPTWENPEEEAGSKISAWIPDWVGGGPGFFLNPLSLPAEITHLLWKGSERHGGDFGLALRDFMAGRFSGLSKGLWTFFTGTTTMGVPTKGGVDRLKKSLGEAAPVPISGGAIVRGAKQLVTGEHQEKYPGQFQKQILQSAGIKTEQAPNAERRIRDLAVEFNRAHKVAEDSAYPPGRFAELTAAIRRQNMTDANDALDTILQTEKANGQPTTLMDVSHYFRKWQTAAFTRSAAREAQFRSTLTAEQEQTYQKARNERRGVMLKVSELLKERAQK